MAKKISSNHWLLLGDFLACLCNPLLSGTINPQEVFFSFLAKFGFQKTETLNKDATQGYIYGNITYNRPSNKNDTDTFDKATHKNFKWNFSEIN